MTSTTYPAGEIRGISAWITLPEPFLANLMTLEPFDLISIDMQHAMIDRLAAARLIEASLHGRRPAAVRIPVGDFALASFLLDAGASAIIAPMINSASEAENLIAATKYPGLGARSWGPQRALLLHGVSQTDYLQTANRTTKAIAMIETRTALENLDEILAVAALDGVFIGPADLSLALTDGNVCDPAHPLVETAVADITRRARAVGKVAWAYAHTPERARALRRHGVDVVALSSDANMMRAGAQAMIAEASDG